MTKLNGIIQQALSGNSINMAIRLCICQRRLLRDAGGYLAHRGSGVASSKYGKIEDLVVSIEVVLPDGTIIETPLVPRHAAGPDLNQLFIGSEGTLGIITRATMKMFDIPEKRSFRAFLFDDMSNAIKAGRALMTNGATPSILRLYDPIETRERVKSVLDIDTTGALHGERWLSTACRNCGCAGENCSQTVLDSGAQDLGPELESDAGGEKIDSTLLSVWICPLRLAQWIL